MSTTAGYGVSDTLKYLFEGLRQTTKEDGITPVYHDKDVRELAKHICCRNYGFLCWELTHLYWAIVNAYPELKGQSNWVSFFWIDRPFSPKRFRAAFSQGVSWQNGEVILSSDTLNISNGTTKFSISPTRVSVLATFNEFLLSVDPRLIQGFQSELVHADINKVKQLSSQLQTALYEFLKAHLPHAQQQTRFRYFENWLTEENLIADVVNDDDIFRFWEHASEDPDAESYKRFQTAFFDVLDSLTAFKVVESQYAVAFAQTIGGDFESGEFDVGDWHDSSDLLANNFTELAFSDVDEEFDVSSLSKQPKCLSQVEVAAIDYPLAYQAYTARFVLSFLRLYVFDKWQAVVIQAMRKSKSTVYEKLQQTPVDNYFTYLQLLKQCLESLVHSRQCLLHVLLQIDPQTATPELLQDMPEDTLAGVAHWINENGHEGESHMLFKKLTMHFPVFRQAIEGCDNAYKNNNKAGFKVVPEASESELYAETLTKVNKTLVKLDGYIHKIEQLLIDEQSLDTKFSSDVCIFSNRFNSLYGDKNAGE